MTSSKERPNQEGNDDKSELKTLVRAVLDEFASVQTKRSEPAYKAELEDEKRKRESLERRLNELVDENRRSRALAESLERETMVKSELQKHGVAKVELAYKALKDDVQRDKDGSLVIRLAEGAVPVKEYIPKFLDENPELLPARNLSGSGAGSSPRSQQSSPGVDIDLIRPGMSAEDKAKVRNEISKLAQIFDK